MDATAITQHLWLFGVGFLFGCVFIGLLVTSALFDITHQIVSRLDATNSILASPTITHTHGYLSPSAKARRDRPKKVPTHD